MVVCIDDKTWFSNGEKVEYKTEKYTQMYIGDKPNNLVGGTNERWEVVASTLSVNSTCVIC